MDVPEFFQRPLRVMALAACLGAWSGSRLAFGWEPLLLGAGLLSALWAAARRATPSAAAVLAAGIFFVYAALSLQAGRPRPDDVSAWAPREDILLTGILAALPAESALGRGWQGVLQCTQAQWAGRSHAVSGRVLFRLPAPLPAWNPGDRVSVRGKLAEIPGPDNPAEFDYREYLRLRGIRAVLQGLERGDAWRLRAARFGWGPLAGGLHRRCVEAIRRRVLPREQGWLLSVLAGDRARLSLRQREAMSAAGLAHVLAVSGMHVGLVFSLLWGLGRLAGIPGRIVAGPAFVGALLFALAAGARPPAMRAVVMLGCVLGAAGSGRRTDPLSGLALAALLLLAWQPLLCRDAGAQFSFVATAAILLTLPAPALPGARKGRWRAWLLAPLRMTTAAWLGTAPLSLYYFSALSPAGFIANLAATPLVTAMIGGGLATVILDRGVPGLGALAGTMASGAAAGLSFLATYAESWPWSRIFLWPPPAWWIPAAWAAALALLLRPWRLAGGFSLLLLLAVYPLFQPPPVKANEVRLTFLSLRLGEAALLEQGRARILIDTGSEGEFLMRVKPFLASRGINRLTALLISHWDDDHAGGVEACSRYFRPGCLLQAGFPENQHIRLARRLSGSGMKRHELRRGQKFALPEGIRLTAVWPPPGRLPSGNRGSLVVLAETRGGGVLFTGDAGADSEAQWLLPKCCRVLKVGHHGSRHSTGVELLLKSLPQVAVVSPGSRNPFGFPAGETLKRLRRFCGQILDTRARGAVEVRLRPREPVRWRTWK